MKKRGFGILVFSVVVGMLVGGLLGELIASICPPGVVKDFFLKSIAPEFGPGTLNLSATNTYTGATTVEQGTLTLTGGGLTGTSSVTIDPGAAVNLSGPGNNQLRGPWTIGGTLTVTTPTAHTLYGDVTLNNGTMDSTGGYYGNYGAYYVGTSANRILTANGANNTISGNGRLGITSGRTLTLSTPLAGDALTVSTVIGAGASGTAGSLAKSGAGTVTLTGANTYTGATNVTGGTLKLMGGQNRLISSPITVASGAILTCQDYAQTLNGILTLSGGTVSGTGETGWGSWILRNQVHATADSTMSAVRMTAANSGSGGFNVDSGATLNVTGTIENTNEISTVNKTGAGTLTLTGTNTYTGTTTVNEGTLLVEGTLHGDVDVRPGGIISAGSSPGHMIITDSSSYTQSGTMLVELGGPAQGAEYDWIEVNDGAADVAGLLDVLLVDFQPASGATFDVLTATDGVTDSGITLNWNPAQLLPAQYWKYSIEDLLSGGQALRLEVGVPEPSTFALAALGLLGLALAGWRRRRRS